MADTTHDHLSGILRRLPSDFEPWGQRSRDNDWGPDCSCGCRWFIRLQASFNPDWGICSNPGSPRCGLLTFEHQGCREFEASHTEVALLSRDGAGTASPGNDRETEIVLLKNLERHHGELAALLEECTGHWGFEDPIYRFYHQSFKVFGLQKRTQEIVGLLRTVAPNRSLSLRFLAIIEAGTEMEFRPDTNANWDAVTRPIVEAFLHARFFLEMTVRYSKIDRPPDPLPSGYAALLCLCGLR